MKDKRILLAVLLTGVFLIITGITYAYFSLVVSGNDVAETINVSTTKIELIYTDGNEIKVDSIEPKWTTTKTITVENTGNEEAYYALGWQKLYNEIQKEELVIRSTCTSSGATGGTCDNTDNVVVPQTSEVTAETNKVIYPYKENVKILPGEKHTYTVTIEFINYDDKAQNYNQGKRFYGVLGAAESSKKLTISDVCQNTTFASCLKDNYELAGLTEIDQAATGNQNYVTAEYRYQGKTPNNYITFNGETGVWRIIGVFEVETPQSDGTYTKENKVKLIRDRIGTAAWNEVNSATNYSDWTTATLMTTLNSGDYYNRTGTYASNGLTDNAKNQISSTKWYLGNVTYGSSSKDCQGTYQEERSTNVYSGNKQTWDGKVALIYPSDYMYASSSCYNNGTIGFNYDDSICKSTNWLLDTNNWFWAVSPSSSSSDGARYVNNSGKVNTGDTSFSSGGVRQSVYLDTSVKYMSGDGSSNNPFVIE